MTKIRRRTVMYSDIADFAKINEADEEEAFNLQSKSRKIHKNCIQKHHGVLIRGIGDKMLASFQLPSDGVRCVADIQREARGKNLPLKIGLHVGEIIYKGYDVYGEGVNTAGQLEEISEEGCVMISGQVYDHVKYKKGFSAYYQGEKKLENRDSPVKLYQIKFTQKGRETSFHSHTADWKKHKLPYIVIGFLILILLLTFIWGWFLLPVIKKKIRESGRDDNTITLMYPLKYSNNYPAGFTNSASDR